METILRIRRLYPARFRAWKLIGLNAGDDQTCHRCCRHHQNSQLWFFCCSDGESDNEVKASWIEPLWGMVKIECNRCKTSQFTCVGDLAKLAIENRTGQGNSFNVVPQIVNQIKDKSPCKSGSRGGQDKAQPEEENHREWKPKLCLRQQHRHWLALDPDNIRFHDFIVGGINIESTLLRSFKSPEPIGKEGRQVRSAFFSFQASTHSKRWQQGPVESEWRWVLGSFNC